MPLLPDRLDEAKLLREHVSIVSFCELQWMGWRSHPALAEALVADWAAWGMGPCTPRSLVGCSVLDATEARLARRMGCEDAVLVSSSSVGLQAVLGTMSEQPVTVVGSPHAVVWSAAEAHSGGHDELPTAEPPAPGSLLIADALDATRGRPIDPRHLLGPGVCLVVDDSSGLGLYGTGDSGYGRGGGGLLPFHGLKTDQAVVVASTAKALGVPLAVVAGPRSLLQAVRSGPHVEQRTPPALPMVRALGAVLDLDEREGEARRGRLLSHVQLLQSALAHAGLPAADGWLHPVISLRFADPTLASRLREALFGAGMLATSVSRPANLPTGSVLRFSLTTMHTTEQVGELAHWLARELATHQAALLPGGHKDDYRVAAPQAPAALSRSVRDPYVDLVRRAVTGALAGPSSTEAEAAADTLLDLLGRVREVPGDLVTLGPAGPAMLARAWSRSCGQDRALWLADPAAKGMVQRFGLLDEAVHIGLPEGGSLSLIVLDGAHPRAQAVLRSLHPRLSPGGACLVAAPPHALPWITAVRQEAGQVSSLIRPTSRLLWWRTEAPTPS